MRRRNMRYDGPIREVIDQVRVPVAREEWKQEAGGPHPFARSERNTKHHSFRKRTRRVKKILKPAATRKRRGGDAREAFKPNLTTARQSNMTNDARSLSQLTPFIMTIVIIINYSTS